MRGRARRRVLRVAVAVAIVTVARRWWRERPPGYSVVGTLGATGLHVDTSIEGVDFSVGFISSLISGFLSALTDWVLQPIATAVSWAATQVANIASRWVNDIWNWIGEVRNLATSLYGFVQQKIQDAVDALVALVNIAMDGVNQLLNGLGDATSWVWQQVSVIVWTVLDDAMAVGHALWAWAVHVIETYLQDALTFGGWLLDQLTGLATGVFYGLVQPVWDALNAITSTMYDLVRQAVTDLLGTLTDVGTDVLGVLAGALDFLRWVVTTGTATVVTVLTGVWRFLVFVAEHPLDWWYVWADNVLANGNDWLLQQVADALDSNAGTVDSWLAQHL